MMPMRLPAQRPAGVAAHWAAESLMEGQSQLAVRFEFKDSRLPPGAIERCVGNFGVVWATLESQV